MTAGPDDPTISRHRKAEEIDELREEIRHHPGTVAFKEWKSLSRSLAIFEGNFTQLQEHVQAPAGVPWLGIELVKGVGDTSVREAFTAELDRTLHNLVAAAFSLVDHARKLVQGYPESAFEAEYEARKDSFVAQPVAPFMQKLRNYLLHVGQAPIKYRHHMDMAAGVETNSVLLEGPSLLEWSNWGPAARGHIEASGDGIEIAVAASEYAALVRSLYEWVFSQFEVLHSEDVRASDALRRRYNDLLHGGA